VFYKCYVNIDLIANMPNACIWYVPCANDGSQMWYILNLLESKEWKHENSKFFLKFIMILKHVETSSCLCLHDDLHVTVFLVGVFLYA
jgi:hypothetical protein